MLAGAIGLISLSLPMVLSGIGMMLLALILYFVMREQNFHPTPAADRDNFGQLADTFKHGLAVARRRPVVRALVLISLVSGLSSEAFDRLWSVKILLSLSQLAGAIGFALTVSGLILSPIPLLYLMVSRPRPRRDGGRSRS